MSIEFAQALSLVISNEYFAGPVRFDPLGSIFGPLDIGNNIGDGSAVRIYGVFADELFGIPVVKADPPLLCWDTACDQ